MPTITLPDGQQKQFDHPVSVAEVAAHIGSGLAKAALAGKVNEQLVDLSYVLSENASISIITDKDNEGLEVLRHSCAHLLAQATQRLFPEVQVTIGPVIEDGFYYDFATPQSFTVEDLKTIESEMARIIQEDLRIERQEVTRTQAIALFTDKKEHYKVEIIKSLPEGEVLSLYKQGDFIDLCRGPHVPTTGKIKAFKLIKVAGAYWRGDSQNEMLQRIYGTAWGCKKQLKTYLTRIAEAEKRDHRKIGKKQDLFHFQDIAPGMVFWHHNGWVIYQVIEQYLRHQLRDHDYEEIKTPQMLDRSLWEKSGHWDKFQENMFSFDAENRTYAIKPMNCPGHVQIYNHRLRSYRDLPLRLAEFGSCHRYEPSGSLHGLMRVRNFVQDDAHIFCTESQLQAEVASCIDLVFKVYRDFGFNTVLIKLSTRPQKRLGNDASWDKAESSLARALEAKDLAYELLPGEGAFYGPKIEFSLTDCLGRIWQCGTIQVDFCMPENLGAEYIDENGQKTTPVMLHRAIIGTFERFLGILIEEVAGVFPPWLAPTQVMILHISEKQATYVEQVYQQLSDLGFRVKKDLRNEKIGFKIREHTLQKVPYLVILGDQEVQQQTLSVRTREGVDLGVMTVNEFAARLQHDLDNLARK